MKKIKRTVICLLVVSTVLMAVFTGYDRMRRDEEKPVITCPETVLETSVSVTEEALLAGVSASDSRDGEVDVVVEKLSPVDDAHQRTVTYAAADSAGNVSRATRTLQYTDYHPPRFQMTGAPRATTAEGPYALIGKIRASDVTGRDLSGRIRFGTLDSRMANEQGIHLLELRVTDAFGFNQVLPIEVDVYDPAGENIRVELKEYLIYLPLNGTLDAAAYFLESSQPGTLQVESDVNSAVPGVYYVDYTVRGETENSIGRSRMVVVVEQEGGRS